MYYFIYFLGCTSAFENSSTLQDSEPEIEDQIAEGEKGKAKGNILLLGLYTFSFPSSPARSPLPNAFFGLSLTMYFCCYLGFILGTCSLHHYIFQLPTIFTGWAKKSKILSWKTTNSWPLSKYSFYFLLSISQLLNCKYLVNIFQIFGDSCLLICINVCSNSLLNSLQERAQHCQG